MAWLPAGPCPIWSYPNNPWRGWPQNSPSVVMRQRGRRGGEELAGAQSPQLAHCSLWWGCEEEEGGVRLLVPLSALWRDVCGLVFAGLSSWWIFSFRLAQGWFCVSSLIHALPSAPILTHGSMPSTFPPGLDPQSRGSAKLSLGNGDSLAEKRAATLPLSILCLGTSPFASTGKWLPTAWCLHCPIPTARCPHCPSLPLPTAPCGTP